MKHDETNFTDERELEALLIAYDYCVLGLRGTELAEHRDLAPATIARRLRYAREKKFIREPMLNIPPERLNELYPYIWDINLMKALQSHIGKENLRHLIVVPSADDEQDADDKQKKLEENLKRVGKSAATRILNIFEEGQMKKVGVSCGRTLLGLVNEMENLITEEKKTEQTEWIPIFGDWLLTPNHKSYSLAFESAASMLAARLARAFRGDATNQLLLSTPAYIPRGFMESAETPKLADNRISMVREFMTSIPVYRTIFGASKDPEDRDPEALITQMDTIILSIGGGDNIWLGMASEQSQCMSFGPVYDEKEWATLEKEIVGDLCGTFITMNQVHEFPEGSVIAQVNDRVLGSIPSDLQKCAERARMDGTPGVIVVASGKSKAAAVACAISKRCVTELVCDSDLAEELAKIKHVDIKSNRADS